CKNRVPGLEVTTDIIVGFPGETEEQFQNTLRLCEEVHFSKIHIFPYSDRRGTRAISMENKCSRNTIKQRVKELGVLEEKLAILSMKKYEGAILSVLGEEETKEKETIGITGNYFRVRFPGIGFRNRLSLVKIHSVEGREMLGLKIANENFEIF
ncbi:MAG: tRNA (N(6)-L-threonylcarbamoyladenosine(37)-C(2))-methylthiotransferase MtaB, partial [Planctomycetota bacterium]